MRKTLLLPLAALLAIAVVAPNAKALTVKPGQNFVHFTDASSLYTVDGIPRAPTDMDSAPGTGGSNVGYFADTVAVVGDELRIVSNVDTLQDANLFKYYLPPGGELTGLIYDLNLNLIVGNPVNGDATLYFGTAAGYDDPSPGGVLDLWVDSSPEGTADLNALYDPSSDGKAPTYWAPGAGPGGTDAYPTVNLGDAGSSLWATFNFQPQGEWVDHDLDGGAVTLPIWVNYLVKETISLPANNGTMHQAWLHILGGSAAPLFGPDFYGPDVELLLQATLSLPGDSGYDSWPQDNGNWAVSSSDPGKFNIIPEPSSLTLLGFGLVSLVGGVIRRRRRS